MINNLLFKKGKRRERDVYLGSIEIDSDLTLYYLIYFGGLFFNTSVSSNGQFSGTFFECEDLLDSLDEAKKAIDDFVTLVKKDPDVYKD